jgi:hypothetical protein
MSDNVSGNKRRRMSDNTEDGKFLADLPQEGRNKGNQLPSLTAPH